MSAVSLFRFTCLVAVVILRYSVMIANLYWNIATSLFITLCLCDFVDSLRSGGGVQVTLSPAPYLS